MISSRSRSALIALPLLFGALAGCGSGGAAGTTTRSITIVVSAPTSTSPWIAQFERNGATLAADQINANGGLPGTHRRVVIQVLDNAGSPQTAAANARQAVDEHAAALIIDGVGAAAVADITKPSGLPVFVVFDGGGSIIDAKRRPTLFRMAPADSVMTVRLADYLAARHPRIAILGDDTSYGGDGASSLRAAFARDDIPVASAQTVPASAADVSTQVLAARRSGATTLVVWATSSVVANVISAARSSGWKVPSWTGPSGEDPLVRQRLAGHVQWLDGVGFVSFRITAEVGPAPFAAYRKAYVTRFGEIRVGVSQGGRRVVQPPDWSMFPYDVVNLVAAAFDKAAATHTTVLAALEGNVVIRGANGDERGYSEATREGVSPDDVYFARFTGFVFAPVTDDLLSQHLPSVPQTAG